MIYVKVIYNANKVAIANELTRFQSIKSRQNNHIRYRQTFTSIKLLDVLVWALVIPVIQNKGIYMYLPGQRTWYIKDTKLRY